MNPDDTNTNPLDAAYAVVLDMLRPNPVLHECTPVQPQLPSHRAGSGAEL